MRHELMTLDEAAQVFARIIDRRPPWINLSIVGLIERDILLICVEPSTTHQSSDAATSCNYSGPTNAVTNAGWDASAAIDLEDP